MSDKNTVSGEANNAAADLKTEYPIQSIPIDAVNELFKHLPNKTRTHCVRSSLIARAMALRAATLPEGTTAEQFADSVREYGICHHFGNDLDYPVIITCDVITAFHFFTCPPGSLTAELVSIASEVDRILGDKKRPSLRKLAAFVKNGKFSAEALDCYRKTQSDIRRLYFPQGSRAAFILEGTQNEE